MRLERGIYASREALISSGTALGVGGDNIANINTDGFKSSSTKFEDLFPYANDQGNNIEHGGGGVKVSAVQQNHKQGAIELTDRQLDMAINGSGFFMTGAPDNFTLTRNGSFSLNPEGFLVDNAGNNVLGFQAGSEDLGPIDMLFAENGAAATQNYAISGILDSRVPESAPPVGIENFNDIQAAASFSSTATVFDSLGAGRDIQLYYFKDGPDPTNPTNGNNWTVQAYTDGSEVGGTAGVPTLLGGANLAFDEFGNLAEGNNAFTFNAPWEGAEANDVTVDLSELSQIATNSTISNFERDGQSAGTLESYEIGENGDVFGRLTSGQLVQVGSIQIASPVNVDGLERVGSNSYAISGNSGDNRIGAPGAENRGSLVGGSLERSNVDLATEFVDLTQRQSAYSAQSQVLTTVNGLVQRTIELIR